MPNGAPGGKAGPQQRITLGSYPATSLAAARDKARELRESVYEFAVDPLAQRAAAEADTFAVVLSDYIDQQLKATNKSWDIVKLYLEKHALPEWHDKPARAITKGDVHGLLDKVRDRDGPLSRVGAAREVRKHLHTMFVWAQDRERVTENPVSGLRRPDLAPNHEDGVELTDEQLRELWNVCLELGFPTGDQIRLLMLTGTRKQEFGYARWSRMREDRYELAPADDKSRRGQFVMLSSKAREIVAGMPRRAGQDYLFWSPRRPRASQGWRLDSAKLKPVQNRLDWNFRCKDLRTTFRSRLGAHGVNPIVSELCLGHKLPSLIGIYDKHAYERERLAAVELFWEKLDV